MASTQGFGVIPPRRAASEVVAQVKRQILAGKLRPGDRLPSEQDFAVQLGVSRPTLRESLSALTSMNIVETRHGEGTFVSSLEPQELAEPLQFLMHVHDDAIFALFEARAFIEAGSARLSAQRRGDDDVAALRQLCDDYADQIEDLDACIQLDFAFHKRIADSSGNAILASLLDSFASLAKESRRRTGSDPSIRSSAHHDHEVIVEAIAAGDPGAAEAAMITHLQHVSEALRSS